MLHYNRFGEVGKPVIVFIHGFLGSEKIYNDVFPYLKSEFDLLTIDLPGHGNSPIDDVEATVEGYVVKIEEILKSENIQKATWIGHSMGGYLVLKALELHLPTVEKAILAYSAVGNDDQAAIEKRTSQQTKIRENGVTSFVEATLPAFFKEGANKEVIEKAIAVGKEASEEGLIYALDVMKSRPNQQTTIDTTTTPVLIIEGQQDKIVQPIDTTNPQVQKVETNTGHLGMMEEPKIFSDYVKEFITTDFI